MIEGMMLVGQITLGVLLGQLLYLATQYGIMWYRVKRLMDNQDALLDMYKQFVEETYAEEYEDMEVTPTKSKSKKSKIH